MLSDEAHCTCHAVVLSLASEDQMESVYALVEKNYVICDNLHDIHYLIMYKEFLFLEHLKLRSPAPNLLNQNTYPDLILHIRYKYLCSWLKLYSPMTFESLHNFEENVANRPL